MHHKFQPHGICPHQITFDLEGDVVRNVHFDGGCSGNLQAISRAVEGMTAQQVEQLFKGIECGSRGTSCSDQLATLVRRALEEQGGA